MEVQDGLVGIADLLIDHQRDLPSRDEAFFFLCSFFLKEDSSVEVSLR